MHHRIINKIYQENDDGKFHRESHTENYELSQTQEMRVETLWRTEIVCANWFMLYRAFSNVFLCLIFSFFAIWVSSGDIYDLQLILQTKCYWFYHCCLLLMLLWLPLNICSLVLLIILAYEIAIYMCLCIGDIFWFYGRKQNRRSTVHNTLIKYHV